MLRSAVIAASLLWAFAAVASGGVRPPDCSAKREGALAVATFSVRSKGRRPFALEQRETRNLETGTITTDAIVRRGQQIFLRVTTSRETSGAGEGRIVYERGFKGIHEITFTTDGTTVRGMVDGRATAPIPLAAAPKAVVFADGAPAPRLRTRGLLRRMLARLGRQARSGCPAESAVPARLVPGVALQDPLPPEPPRAVDPSESESCIWCQAKCAGEYVACLAAAVESGPFVVFSGPACMLGGQDCIEGCVAPGKACCPNHCGTLCCSAETTCCGDFACCSPGSYCASPALSICCPTGAVACRGGCCPVGDKCVAGFYCCPADAGDFCGQELGCCPPGQRCFEQKIAGVVVDQVCCDRDPCHGTCCPAGEVCSDTGCCDPLDLCGTVCCPRAEGNVCLNGTTCCQAGKACGGGCCPGFATCCNGTCCPNLGDRCIGGLCCPENRACGNACCPEGYTCTNAATGTCQPCPLGEAPCAFGSGAPACCPLGTTCCGNGACCAANEQCCVFKQGLGCYTSCAN
jgi:hypothetical protein